MNDKRANKTAQLTRRGVCDSRNPDGKSREVSSPTQMANPRSAVGLAGSKTLHLPTLEREVFLWRSCRLSAAEMLYLLTASPGEEGIGSALIVPPSISQPSSPNPSAPRLVAGVHRAGGLRALHFISSFSLCPGLQDAKSALQNMSDWVGAEENVYILCLLSL